MGNESSRTAVALSRWNSGDREGLQMLLEDHLDWIRARVRSRLGPKLRRKAESGDLVQDALVSFLKSAPKLHISSPAAFRSLMAQIVENALRDKNDWIRAKCRAISRECPLPSDTILAIAARGEAPSTPSARVQHREEEAWVRIGLQLLDEEERGLILLRDFEGATFGAIQERLGFASYDEARRRYLDAVDRLGDRVASLREGVDVDEP